MTTTQAAAHVGHGLAPLAMEPSTSCGTSRGTGAVNLWRARTCARLPSVAGQSYRTLSRGISAQDFSVVDKVSSGIRRKLESQRPRVATRDRAEASFAAQSLSPDLFLLDLASKLEDSLEGESSEFEPLSRLREEATEATLNCRWPTRKDEAYRFTDLKFLKDADIYPVDATAPDTPSFDLSSLNFSVGEGNRLIFIDGVLSKPLSELEGLAEGVIVGSISSLSEEVVQNDILPKLSSAGDGKSQGDVFASLNGVGARDLGVIVVPAGVKVSDPIQIVYISTQGEQGEGQGKGTVFRLSNPRLLVLVGQDGELNFVEDFVGATETAYWTNSVCEIVIAERGVVCHNLVQEENRNAAHIRQTSISQAESSSYKLVETCFGGRLSRHNLQVLQSGSDTSTEFYSFLLAGRGQLHDLHSKLVLNHPRGFSRQLHKCIVTDSSGHAVFDGNVRVNRYAQQTDAGQLSRSLLLAPKATVNVKPNLQIIANDVKCTHGAAISDLDDEQLFYFRARGIDIQTARSSLVFSFGAEVVQKLGSQDLKKRVESLVKSSLAAEGVIKSGLPVSSAE